ncbi:ELMO/CED-12 family protein [Giardia muris]|uniref:ELMO/CED-12 family protein n=1 Tax=Giardia muris TaxID=5742 RepID=A0A4Z1SXG1_GIAMU|nr:ELMO/CED-12 family protein [Giardia muris]|eukprot:TNJ30414.1 ELMO/CED-12 family protein [Giardia muris]
MQTWFKQHVMVIFDVHPARNAGHRRLWQYKRMNCVPCFLLISPLFDFLFVPTQDFKLRASSMKRRVPFIEDDHCQSILGLYEEVMLSNEKKHPMAFDYRHMFPLLVCGVRIKEMALVSIEPIDDDTTETEQNPDTMSTRNAILVTFTTFQSRKKYFRIGLSYSDSGLNDHDPLILDTSLLLPNIHGIVSLLRASDTKGSFQDLKSSSEEPVPHLDGSQKDKETISPPSPPSSSSSSPPPAKPIRTKVSGTKKKNRLSSSIVMADSFFSTNLTKCYVALENMRRRTAQVLGISTAIIANNLELYKDLRGLHLSMTNQVHQHLLADISRRVVQRTSLFESLKDLTIDQVTADSLGIGDTLLLQILRQHVLHAFEHPSIPHPFLWKRLGFQSDSPLSDFRATSLPALILLHCFARQCPDCLLTGTYDKSESDSDADRSLLRHLLWYCTTKDKETIVESLKRDGHEALIEPLEAFCSGPYELPYSYPVAVSILNVAHYVFTHPLVQPDEVGRKGPLVTLLEREYACRYIQFSTDAIMVDKNALVHKYSTNQNDYLLPSQLVTGDPNIEGRIQVLSHLFGEKVIGLAREALKASLDHNTQSITMDTVGDLDGPWSEFCTPFWEYYEACGYDILPLTLDAPAPLCDGLFRLGIGVTIILYKFLRRIPVVQRCLQFPRVFGLIKRALDDALEASVNIPCYSVDTLLIRVQHLVSLDFDQ